jgi:hypothetical protein
MPRCVSAGFAAAQVGVLRALLTVLALSAGCGHGGSGPPPGPELFQHTALQEVGDLFRLHALDTKKPPARLADLARYKMGMPTGYQEVDNGNIIVSWGTPLSDTAAATVLAYEKAAPDAGGFVLMQDGKTIKKLTAEEFKAAPKAGGGGTGTGK